MANQENTENLFNGAMSEMTSTEMKQVDVTLEFISKVSDKRSQIVAQRDGKTFKGYCFTNVVEDIAKSFDLPCRARLLIEKKVRGKKEYWNITALTTVTNYN